MTSIFAVMYKDMETGNTNLISEHETINAAISAMHNHAREKLYVLNQDVIRGYFTEDHNIWEHLYSGTVYDDDILIVKYDGVEDARKVIIRLFVMEFRSEDEKKLGRHIL